MFRYLDDPQTDSIGRKNVNTTRSARKKMTGTVYFHTICYAGFLALQIGSEPTIAYRAACQHVKNPNMLANGVIDK